MYSNINENLLKKYVKMGAELAGLNTDSIKYIFSLIEVNMRHSYFHEPDGIFRTNSGFSMGDVAASRGLDVLHSGRTAFQRFVTTCENTYTVPGRYIPLCHWLP